MYSASVVGGVERGQRVSRDTVHPKCHVCHTEPQTRHLDTSRRGKHSAYGAPRGGCNREDGVKAQEKNQVYHPRAGKRDENHSNEGRAR
jgi:hypothetical protein